jgi:hypothetical protein
MEAARKVLEGRWVLVSLNVTAEDGRSAGVEASGTLTSDAFGNMNIEVRMTDAGRKALEGLGVKTPNPVISTTGQVAIDVQQRRITYVGEGFDKRGTGFDPDLAARRANPPALLRHRRRRCPDADHASRQRQGCGRQQLEEGQLNTCPHGHGCVADCGGKKHRPE